MPKQNLEILSTDEGRQIDSSEKHWWNAASPRLDSVEPRSSVKLESVEQEWKQN
jgi:hypothetical protein